MPSLPYLRHKELTGQETTCSPVLRSLTACTRGSGGLNRCHCSKMRPPTPATPSCLYSNLRGPKRSSNLGQAARQARRRVVGWTTRSSLQTLPCKLLRTRSRAQWGDSAPRTTLVPCGPPSKELANTRRGKPSNRAKMETGWEPGPSNQEGGDISSEGKGARG